MTTVHENSATGCSVKPQITIKPRAVSVNGVVIPREAIARETQNHSAPKAIEAWQAAPGAGGARASAAGSEPAEYRRRALQDDEGRRETDEEARMRGLLECEVPVPVAEEAELRRYYENNRKSFTAPALFAVSHILIAQREERSDARDVLRQRAEAILAQLRADPALFASLAEMHSDCPSREVGGQLGQVSAGQTVPEFEAMLPGLPVGAKHVSMVESRYGFHLVTVHQRVPEAVLPFDKVRERIASFLELRARMMAERHYIQHLASRARIEGITLQASKTPLVQ